jgi:hypothetical protein
VGCASCRRELAVHQAMSRRLSLQPPVAAPPELRERIVASIAAMRLEDATVAAPAPRAPWISRRSIAIAAGVAVLALGATVAFRATTGEPAVAVASNLVAVAPASVPLLSTVLADYRRVVASDLPGRARDLEVVRAAMPFPVEPLRVPNVRLVAVWTTELAGEPSAVLAYRWGDRIVLQYLVSEERFFQHASVRGAVSDGRLLLASDRSQGLVAWPADAAGALLVGDVDAERLAGLVTSELLARRGRAGTQ